MHEKTDIYIYPAIEWGERNLTYKQTKLPASKRLFLNFLHFGSIEIAREEELQHRAKRSYPMIPHSEIV